MKNISSTTNSLQPPHSTTKTTTKTETSNTLFQKSPLKETHDMSVAGSHSFSIASSAGTGTSAGSPLSNSMSDSSSGHVNENTSLLQNQFKYHHASLNSFSSESIHSMGYSGSHFPDPETSSMGSQVSTYSSRSVLFPRTVRSASIRLCNVLMVRNPLLVGTAGFSLLLFTLCYISASGGGESELHKFFESEVDHYTFATSLFDLWLCVILRFMCLIYFVLPTTTHLSKYRKRYAQLLPPLQAGTAHPGATISALEHKQTTDFRVLISILIVSTIFAFIKLISFNFKTWHQPLGGILLFMSIFFPFLESLMWYYTARKLWFYHAGRFVADHAKLYLTVPFPPFWLDNSTPNIPTTAYFGQSGNAPLTESSFGPGYLPSHDSSHPSTDPHHFNSMESPGTDLQPHKSDLVSIVSPQLQTTLYYHSVLTPKNKQHIPPDPFARSSGIGSYPGGDGNMIDIIPPYGEDSDSDSSWHTPRSQYTSATPGSSFKRPRAFSTFSASQTKTFHESATELPGFQFFKPYSPKVLQHKYSEELPIRIGELWENVFGTEENGWNYYDFSDGVAKFRKSAPNSALTMTKGFGVLPFTPREILTIFADIELATDWDSSFYNGNVEEELAPGIEAVWIAYKGQYIVKGRDLSLVRCISIYDDLCLENFSEAPEGLRPVPKSVMAPDLAKHQIYTKNPTKDDPPPNSVCCAVSWSIDHPGIPDVSTHIRAELQTSGLILVGLPPFNDKPQTWMCYCSQIDLKGSLPTWAVNKVAENTPKTISEQLKFMKSRPDIVGPNSSFRKNLPSPQDWRQLRKAWDALKESELRASGPSSTLGGTRPDFLNISAGSDVDSSVSTLLSDDDDIDVVSNNSQELVMGSPNSITQIVTQ